MVVGPGVEKKGYGLLKDLKLEVKMGEENANGGFVLCFWLYLNRPMILPSVILHQQEAGALSKHPFLLLNEEKKLMLFPSPFLHEEACSLANSVPWPQAPCASVEIDFPEKKWIHIGCEVLIDRLRIHVDGEPVGQNLIISSNPSDAHGNFSSKAISLSISGGDGGSEVYIHDAEIFDRDRAVPTSPIKSHHQKEPPLYLLIDSSSAFDIEEDTDGVWSIVGGKASCRRNFSLDVILLDALGRPLDKDIEVVASLLYDDNDALVEKPDDAEAPLLTSYDGIEFASSDRPSKLMNGRASFKLKIAQLSSKCDNRLFRIKFDVPKMGRFPFLEVFSPPIRCISRNRNTRSSSVVCKKLSSGIHLLHRSQSPGVDDVPSEPLHTVVREAKPSPSSKRVKLGNENPFAMFGDNLMQKQVEEERTSHACTTLQVKDAYMTCLDGRKDNGVVAENFSSDSENSEAPNSILKSSPHCKNLVSDLIVFRYCLGSMAERSALLKDIAVSATQEELAEFAEQVSLFSGCSHHRQPILISKILIEEGVNTWNWISQNNQHVLWENLVFGIAERFGKVASSENRSLMHQDFELLRRIAGCQDLVSQENFEKMWCWLYPVAFSISMDWINSIWNSLSPKWIEGFITKEEAESSLRGPGSLQDPGTFVLRFPTSRSWPHPDAGNLVVTYVSSDYTVHHRLLSCYFANSFSSKEMKIRPLQELLLEEPELSRLGRIRRAS